MYYGREDMLISNIKAFIWINHNKLCITLKNGCTGSPRFMSIYLATVQSYDSTEKMVYKQSSHLGPLQSLWNVIMIWALGNCQTFTATAVSWGHQIAICNFPSLLLTSKVNGETPIHT